MFHVEHSDGEHSTRTAPRPLQKSSVLGGDQAATSPAEDLVVPKGVATAGAATAAKRPTTQSAKDRAELAMIIDLVRNDLGRVCEPGSVTRTEDIIAEAHPSVWHLVGAVDGPLQAGLDAFDLLQASFPPGSCIGAPKIRAMEILEGLERSRRGAYTGAIGWIGADGAMATSVTIRTIVFRGGRAEYGVGGGIVYDSDPDQEWEEALLKGRALASALTAGSVFAK